MPSPSMVKIGHDVYLAQASRILRDLRMPGLGAYGFGV